MQIAHLCLRLHTLPDEGGLLQQSPANLARLTACIRAADKYTEMQQEAESARTRAKARVK